MGVSGEEGALELQVQVGVVGERGGGVWLLLMLEGMFVGWWKSV